MTYALQNRLPVLNRFPVNTLSLLEYFCSSSYFWRFAMLLLVKKQSSILIRIITFCLCLSNHSQFKLMIYEK